jgi:tetratricopeptide (TPR) repeat protein
MGQRTPSFSTWLGHRRHDRTPRGRAPRCQPDRPKRPCTWGSCRKYKACCGARQAPRTESSPDDAASQLENLSGVAQRLEVFDRFRPASYQPDPTRHTQPIGARSREANLHRARGNELIGVGRLAEAIVPLQKAIAVDPESATAHRDLGPCSFQPAAALERSGDAIAEYRIAVKLDRKSAEAPGKLGDLLLFWGRHEEAAAWYHRAADASPDSALGQVDRVKALTADGQTDQAEVWIARVRALSRSAHPTRPLRESGGLP